MFSLLTQFLPSVNRNKLVNAFHTTSQLWAEPLKKKKRIDPQILRLREQRKIRKLEKSIRLLKRHAKKLKPIEEMEVSPRLQRELDDRKRPAPNLPQTILSFRHDLAKVWSRVQCVYNLYESKSIKDVLDSQKSAMEELRKVDLRLYNAALGPDMNLLPFKIKAISRTPPLENYETPDGKYADVSKKWRPQSR